MVLSPAALLLAPPSESDFFEEALRADDRRESFGAEASRSLSVNL